MTISISGRISSVPLRSIVSVSQGQRRIDVHTQFRFEKDNWVGDPWEIKPGERMTGRRRSEYDDSYKLLALLPVAVEHAQIYKNAAFDVCRSANSDTFFQSWDAIKHNIVVNWVDILDGSNEFGLAVFTDHTISYAHGENHPLALVMGWGWDGGFWWGKCSLNGVQESRYAIIPHAGRWDKAALWRETAIWSEPLLARISTGGGRGVHPSVVRIESPGVYLSAMTASGHDLLLRFFNAEGGDKEHEIWLGVPSQSMELIELDGRVRQTVRSLGSRGRERKVAINIPQFGVRTLRLSGAV